MQLILSFFLHFQVSHTKTLLLSGIERPFPCFQGIYFDSWVADLMQGYVKNKEAISERADF